MNKNLMKHSLSAGKNVAGVVVSDSSVFNIEILSLSGFDFIFIDCEHAPMSIESVGNMVMAAELRGSTPLVRVRDNIPELILRYMDVGAGGIIIPGIATKEDAQKAVDAVKYPPLGKRGLAGVRAADYGLSGPLGDYVKISNDETIVLGVLENMEGVENISEILDVEGFDGVFIGTNDLSNSLGVAGQTNHPKVLEAIEKILNASSKTNKPIGGVVRGGETPQQYIKKGFKIVLTATQALLAGASKSFLRDLNPK